MNTLVDELDKELKRSSYLTDEIIQQVEFYENETAKLQRIVADHEANNALAKQELELHTRKLSELLEIHSRLTANNVHDKTTIAELEVQIRNESEKVAALEQTVKDSTTELDYYKEALHDALIKLNYVVEATRGTNEKLEDSNKRRRVGGSSKKPKHAKKKRNITTRRRNRRPRRTVRRQRPSTFLNRKQRCSRGGFRYSNRLNKNTNTHRNKKRNPLLRPYL